jgi:WD40 repeat protein
MVYQGRATALAPIYLLRRDFTLEEEPDVMAQDPTLDVRRFAWAPDGTVGASLLADVLVSIEPGEEKRPLGEGITTITFGADASTVYGVRVTQDGANDVATVLRIDFDSADTTELASVTFSRPDLGAQEALSEAQFSDDGGPIRLFFMEDGAIRLWALDAGTWKIDPDDGEVTEIDEALPRLWAPDGSRRVGAGSDEGTTTLTLVDDESETLAETTITGRVSHLRWSPDGERLVFTAGRSAAGGGILQDLFLWDLVDGEAPVQLTSTGAAFGAEWLGSQPMWREE